VAPSPRLPAVSTLKLRLPPRPEPSAAAEAEHVDIDDTLVGTPTVATVAPMDVDTGLPTVPRLPPQDFERVRSDASPPPAVERLRSPARLPPSPRAYTSQAEQGIALLLSHPHSRYFREPVPPTFTQYYEQIKVG